MADAGRSVPGLSAVPAKSGLAVQATAVVKQTTGVALDKHLLVHPLVGSVLLVLPFCASAGLLRASTCLLGPQPCCSKCHLLSQQSPETWFELWSAPFPCFPPLRLRLQLPPQPPAAAAAPAWSKAA